MRTPPKVGKKSRRSMRKYDPSSHVRRCECSDGTSSNEPMRRWLRRKFLQNPKQNLALQIFQPGFGSFDQPDSAEPFRQHPVVVVLEPWLALFVAQGFQVGEPSQFARTQSKPLRQVSRRFNRRDISGPIGR